MSAAQDRLEQAALGKVEAAARGVAGITEADVGRILAAAEAYAQAVAGRATPAISLPGLSPVHFQSSPGRAACRPRERPIAGTLTARPGRVTCGNCHRSAAWRQARATSLDERKPWAVALDEFLAEAPQ